MQKKGHDRKHWEKIGDTYNAFWRSRAKQELSRKELGFINKYLMETKGWYILDIGVGSGRVVENYLVNAKTKEIWGIDWAESMVSFCRNKFRNQKKVKKIVVCNISKEEIPYKHKFDFVSAIRVLKYSRNWQEVIGNTINSLNGNGIVVFTMPNKNSFLRFSKPETAIYTTTRRELEKVVHKQNGEIIQITSFMKLPDIFYDILDNKLYVSVLLWLEKILKFFLGDIFLSRIFFIAVKKRFTKI